MYRHVDDGPEDYPLALNGLSDTQNPSLLESVTNFFWVQTPLSYVLPPTWTGAGQDIAAGDAWRNAPNANRSMTPPSKTPAASKPDLRPMYGPQNQTVDTRPMYGPINRPYESSVFDTAQEKIDGYLPAGYKTGDKVIPNVPNYLLYAGVGIFGIMVLRKLTKRN